MMSAKVQDAATETFRAREVYRYYQPTATTSTTRPPNTSDIPSTGTGDESKHASNFPTTRSFSDTALTAFAQLIALRLNAQRAVVSLIDHENEYFLAESTSTLSLIDDDRHAQNLLLSISGAKVPREASLCEQTLCLEPESGPSPSSNAMHSLFFMVSDLQQDQKLNKLECVTGEPSLRFYAGVPLRNNNGLNIGCVYVVDNRARTDFSHEEAQFLSKMAATVMDHLENKRAREEITRVTMMSQGLHAFIEGDGTMIGDWQRLKKYNLPSGAGVAFSWQTNTAIVKNSSNDERKLGTPTDSKLTQQQRPRSFQQSPMERNPMGTFSPALSSSAINQTLSGTQRLDYFADHGLFPLKQIGSDDLQSSQFDTNKLSHGSDLTQMPLKSVFNGADDIGPPITDERNNEYSNDDFSDLLHSTFSRASNLVREGMEVDGAVFFDAPTGFYQGRSRLDEDTRQMNDEIWDSSSESEEETSSMDLRPGPRPHPMPTKRPRPQKNKTAGSIDQRSSTDNMFQLKSDVLGFSTERSSSLNGQRTESTEAFTAIDQSLMTSLVKHYPQGELFVFDKDGPITPLDDVKAPLGPVTRSKRSVSTIPQQVADHNSLVSDSRAQLKHGRHLKRRREEILRLLVFFPGARQIFFVPLYDHISGCFIGSFAWSTSETRIFSNGNDLSYLVAFGHSVMAEVSRLNTLSADRAKGDFISNVSHELRSPLHGILASAEFLADTSLDGFQKSLIDTIDVCGRTLLETIEAVLDFSKIKKFGKESMQPMGVVSNVDISAIVEEVLEGVFSGFEFNGLSSQGLADITTSRTRQALSRADTSKSEDFQFVVGDDSLTIIVDLDFKEHWNFSAVPGTFRRLVMNLFGNALKYTKVGWIKVKLEARPTIPPPAIKVEEILSRRTMVILTVSDSGIGMSSEFMKTKLFMPFSQEDATAPGTGLGMSIVKQLVDLSGGKIDVRSELGKGTQVKLSLPLDDEILGSDENTLRLNPIHATPEDAVDAVRRRAHGRTVTIRGFDNVSAENAELQWQALASLKASIEKYVTEWFKIKIISPNSEDSETADIVISDESAFLDSAIVSGSDFINQGRSLLILCSNGARRGIYASRMHTDHVVEFVSKPIGPHRLARALLNCFDKEDAKTSANGDTNAFDTSNATISSQGRKRPPSLNDSLSSISRKGPLANAVGSLDEVLLHREETVAPEASIHETRRPKMLLVEDNPVNMMLLATYMKKNNWDFEKGENGLLALQAFESRPQGFDVIFMDVSMPVMTGYESTKAIRKVEAERREARELDGITSIIRPALIIALTGFSSQKDQETAFDCGVDVFMTKPVRFSRVGEILDNWKKDAFPELYDKG